MRDITRALAGKGYDMALSCADSPVFGTGIVLAEQVFALGIASRPAGTDAAIAPEDKCIISSIDNVNE